MSQHMGRRTITRLALATIGAAALAMSTSAIAADITSSATVSTSVNTSGITLDAAGIPVYGTGSRIRMDVKWAVPDGSRGGDTFLVPLDDDLAGSTFLPINLMDASGNVVASTSYDGAGNIRFTLTDFVNDKVGVKGTAWFALGFDQSKVQNVGDNVLDVFGTTIKVTRKPPSSGGGGTGTPPPSGNKSQYKSGWWATGEAYATTQNPDKSMLHADKPQITWAVVPKTKVGSPARDWESVTITDTLGSGQHFDCTYVAGKYTKLGLKLGNGGYAGGSGSLNVDSCSPTSLVLTLKKNADDMVPYGIQYQSWFDLNAQGQPVYTDDNGIQRVGLNPKGFSNKASFDYAGLVSESVATVKRTAQGGDATGATLTPGIDIEKFSGSWEGVKGLDANGQPTNLPTGDYDAAPGLQVTNGAATPITMRITNTGDDVLNNVQVTDTVFGAPVKKFSCTFEGSQAMPFNGLKPGASFTCSAILPANFTGTHKDVSSVTAVGKVSGKKVSDSDAFNAVQKTPPPVVTPPTSNNTGTPSSTPKTPTVPTPPATPSTPVAVTPPPAVQTAATPAPTLAISKRSMTPRVTAGRIATWMITARNIGTGDAAGVQVCDTLPKGTSLTSRSATYLAGGRRHTASVTLRGGSACISVGRLAPSASVSWTLNTNIARTASGRIVNQASVSATNAATARASAVTRVDAPRRSTQLTPAVTG